LSLYRQAFHLAGDDEAAEAFDRAAARHEQRASSNEFTILKTVVARRFADIDDSE
jgi:hypothetical protein